MSYLTLTTTGLDSGSDLVNENDGDGSLKWFVPLPKIKERGSLVRIELNAQGRDRIVLGEAVWEHIIAGIIKGRVFVDRNPRRSESFKNFLYQNLVIVCIKKTPAILRTYHEN